MSTPEKIVRNLTPKRLHIKGSGSSRLVLAPLENNRRLTKEELDEFDYECLVSQNLIKVSDEKHKKFEDFVGALPVIGTFVFFGFIMLNAFTKDRPNLNVVLLVSAGVLVIVGVALVVVLIWMGKYVVLRFLEQSLSLLLVLALGIALPALAIYYFGGGRELLAVKPSLALLGRILQLVFIVTASLLPALLYFLFDRQQLGTLRERFEHQIFRLDPNVKTLIDVEAKYGRQIREIYGPVLETDKGRLIRGTRWPILVATLVITMGWILTLLPADANLVITQPAEILNLFVPRRTAVVFGFLGVYFFALNMSLLRYARADLKPKAYSSIATRFFIVITLAWVISLPLPEGNAALLMSIFILGIFPESGLTLIRESIRQQTGIASVIPYPKEDHPLTDLEGIDVYDRSRLADEGVTNIEALAHHDFIDLMLETRVPVPRLVDWLDQAILYLHLTPSGKVEESVVKTGEAKTPLSFRARLRGYGIRTATDLRRASEEGKLSEVLVKDHESLKQIELILAVLKDDEWINFIEAWRRNDPVKDEEHTAPKPKPSESSGAAEPSATAVKKATELAAAGNGGQA